MMFPLNLLAAARERTTSPFTILVAFVHGLLDGGAQSDAFDDLGRFAAHHDDATHTPSHVRPSS